LGGGDEDFEEQQNERQAVKGYKKNIFLNYQITQKEVALGQDMLRYMASFVYSVTEKLTNFASAGLDLIPGC